VVTSKPKSTFLHTVVLRWAMETTHVCSSTCSRGASSRRVISPPLSRFHLDSTHTDHRAVRSGSSSTRTSCGRETSSHASRIDLSQQGSHLAIIEDCRGVLLFTLMLLASERLMCSFEPYMLTDCSSSHPLSQLHENYYGAFLELPQRASRWLVGVPRQSAAVRLASPNLCCRGGASLP
jgi:hypothetical protein